MRSAYMFEKISPILRPVFQTILIGVLFFVPLWLAVRFTEHSTHSHKTATELDAGTDMFWEMHDRHFPTHYLQDGRVTCTEEQAAKELEGVGLNIER